MRILQARKNPRTAGRNVQRIREKDNQVGRILERV